MTTRVSPSSQLFSQACFGNFDQSDCELPAKKIFNLILPYLGETAKITAAKEKALISQKANGVATPKELIKVKTLEKQMASCLVRNPFNQEEFIKKCKNSIVKHLKDQLVENKAALFSSGKTFSINTLTHLSNEQVLEKHSLHVVFDSEKSKKEDLTYFKVTQKTGDCLLEEISFTQEDLYEYNS